MSPTIRIAILLAMAACAPLPAYAQTHPQPQPTKRANVTYHMVEFLKYKPGQRGRANTLIREYFGPVEKSENEKIADYRMLTGDWDAIEVHPMPGGPGDLEWTTTPRDIRLNAALIKRLGSAEAARKILNEWNSLIERREYHVAYSPMAVK